MAFADAKDSYIAFGASGSEHVFSVSGTPGSISGIDGMSDDVNEHDVTTFGANDEVNQPGVGKAVLIKLTGFYGAEAETYLGALVGVTGKSFVYGPLGNTSGSPKKSSGATAAYVKSFTPKATAKGVVMFDCEIRIASGGIVRGTF